MKKNFRKLKRLSLVLAILLAAYLSLYTINSSCGGYWPWPVAGNYTLGGASPLHKAFMWQPYYGYVDNFNKSAVGYVFYPAIHCDRLWFHPTLDLFSDYEKIFPGTNSPSLKWHPVGVRIAKEKENEKAIITVEMIKHPELCLEQAKYGLRSERHLFALLLFDKYGTEAVEKASALASKAHDAGSESRERAYDKLADEIRSLEDKYYTQLRMQHEIFIATNQETSIESERIP